MRLWVTNKKQAAYDQYGAGANGSFGGGAVVLVAFDGAGFGGFEDIFSSFFGGGASRNQMHLVKGMTSIPRRLKFEEAILVRKKESQVPSGS